MRKLRFILNTFVSGPQAWFFLADDLGYFRDEGIEIDFSPGDTAANAVPRVASGEFDVGYGDINALIELTAKSAAPPNALAVFATFNASPYTIAVPASSAILAPIDLQDRTLGAHPKDAAWLMLPEFAAQSGMDLRRISVEFSPDPHPQMIRVMLEEARWAGLFGFVNTLNSAAIEAKIDPAALRHLQYRDVVPDLYGCALLVQRSLAAREPALVAGLVRAVNRGLVATLTDLDRAIDAVARRNPQIDRKANRARLAGTLALEMAHAEGTRLGIGEVDDARLARAAALIVRAKGYARCPVPRELFDRQFMPPLTDRVTSLAP